MNTDQAYDLLKNAGVSEDIGIQTVRRWLREKKINYEGTVHQDTGYILEDTDQALHLLKDAGVAASTGILIVRRWLREGKIQNVGNGNKVIEYISNETNNHSEQDKTIRELKAKLKLQDEQLKGLEELHKNSINTLIQQRDKLNKEINILENEKSELQRETRKVLKDNLELRKELLKAKEELSKGDKREPVKTQIDSPAITDNYRQKLGLSKTASPKEIITVYKKLLKITHPDHGGNAIAFQYIKMDYDYFKNSIK